MGASRPLFTFRQLATLRAMLADHHIAISALLREVGVPDGQAEITAPLSKVQQLLERAAVRLKTKQLGIELAQRIPAGAYGVTEFVVRTAPTVRHALSALCELSPLVNPALDLRYIADDLGCEVRFTYAGKRDGLGEILNEYTVAYVAHTFASILERALPIERAWFAHERASARDEVASRLGCVVGFGAADCGFAVASDVIDRPIPHGNEALHAFLLAQGRAQLAVLGRHDVITQVTRAIEARIADPTLSAATVARALATSQRTLQRQLADAGTSYRSVVAALRRRRRDELSRSGLDESTIAHRLGFVNARTMRRSLDDS